MARQSLTRTLTDIGLYSYGNATQRLASLSSATPIDASLLWTSWGMEKWLAWNAGCLAAAQAAAVGFWKPLRTPTDALRLAETIGNKACAPIARRVRSNRRSAKR
jgi:hypothetical protein